MKKIETFLPLFKGYYETNESQVIDNAAERELEYFEDEGTTKDDGTPIEWDDFNYSAMFEELSKDISIIVEKMLIDLEIVTRIEYQNTWSPREYNFKTDVINVEMHLSEQNRSNIDKYIADNLEEFQQYIKDKYTSYSGFYSSYPNNAVDFLQGEPLSHAHKLGSILEFILQNEGEEENYSCSLYDLEIIAYLNDNIELTETKS